jgi:hypothetical protein
MLTGIPFNFKIIRQMVMHNKLRNVLKIVKKGYRSIVLFTGFTTFLINRHSF